MMLSMRNKILLAVGLLAAATAFAQPVVNDGGILNAASYANSRLPNGAIAQGSIFVIFGARMGPAAIAQAGFPLQTTLAGTSVRVTSGGTNSDCFLVYTLAGQVAALLPSTTPVGNATLTVTYNGATSASRAVRIVPSSFGTFSTNQAGSGPGIITNFESATSQPVNSVLRSARPGQTLILYGTGLGPLPAGTPDNTAAPAVQIGAANVELYVGSSRANVAYAGRAPGFAGLDQINFTVPAGLSGCSIPVSVKIGTVVSNFTTIAVAPNGGTCSDPLGLSSTQLDRIRSTGSLKLGSISLARIDAELSIPGIGSLSVKSDSGSADFVEYTPLTIESSAGLNAGGAPSYGTCYVFSGSPGSTEIEDPTPLKQLDAGILINVNGPKGAKTLKKVPTTVGFYSETFGTSGINIPGFPGGTGDTSYLDPGTYTFNNGAGGADVGGFNASLTIPAVLNWTNRAAVTTVNRAQGLTVNWTGADPNGYVVIYGYSAVGSGSTAISATFICSERGSAGTFTVPSQVLLALPATPSGSGGLTDLPPGALALTSGSTPVSFTAPGLDVGTVVSTSAIFKSVNYN